MAKQKKQYTKADIIKAMEKAANHPNTDPAVKRVAQQELAKVKEKAS